MIQSKYIFPPKTTDFAILFVPTEALFAEVLRRQGLCDYLQNKHRVILAGPTTLWSILNSLQMGFRTLAIQKRSSEVWKLLAAIKTEWKKYEGLLEKVRGKLQQASSTIHDAERQTRAIGKRLRDVDMLPIEQRELELTVGERIGETISPKASDSEEFFKLQ